MPKKPKLGQNFLRDQTAIRRIVAALGEISQQTVVEIGPGHGAITGHLAALDARVIAIEYDRELAPRLRGLLGSDRVSILEQDVLEFDFAGAAREAGQKLVIVGNLPYYITSPILLKLAENAVDLDRAVLMVQREVADRVAASPGSRDYGLLSVTLQMYGEIEQLFTLPPSAFSPPPEVHSTVFRWRFAPRFRKLGVEEDVFLSFVRKSFAQKRKTVVNNLRAAGCEAGVVQAALSEVGLPPQVRAEELSIETLAQLSLHVQR